MVLALAALAAVAVVVAVVVVLVLAHAYAPTLGRALQSALDAVLDAALDAVSGAVGCSWNQGPMRPRRTASGAGEGWARRLGSTGRGPQPEGRQQSVEGRAGASTPAGAPPEGSHVPEV
jgi:hypothetical protein